MTRTATLLAGTIVSLAVASAELGGLFVGGLDHPAIEYASRPASDRVAELNRKLQNGGAQLQFEDSHGYLRSVLEALHVPGESQMAVFSKTSFQANRISPSNPRALYFGDSVAVGWVRGGPFLEIAAQDPHQGVVFYTVAQLPGGEPQFVRRDDCLQCHESYSTLGVPGMLLRSVFPSTEGVPLRQLGDFLGDGRSPMEQRWGGWYVTGKTGSMRHMGNGTVKDPKRQDFPLAGQTLNLESLEGKFETSDYLSPYSDIAALMVFEHQMHLMNLLTRVGWETRVALYDERTNRTALVAPPGGHHEVTMRLLRDAAGEFVDYLLFVDEAPLPGRVEGGSGFTQKFASAGPRDSKGRSLRQLDLERRLLRYPCSYMIYSDAFDGLPPEARDAIYKRMWEILSGQENRGKYARLSLEDRKAVVEILRETKPGLPEYFQSARVQPVQQAR